MQLPNPACVPKVRAAVHQLLSEHGLKVYNLKEQLRFAVITDKDQTDVHSSVGQKHRNKQATSWDSSDEWLCVTRFVGKLSYSMWHKHTIWSQCC